MNELIAPADLNTPGFVFFPFHNILIFLSFKKKPNLRCFQFLHHFTPHPAFRFIQMHV